MSPLLGTLVGLQSSPQLHKNPQVTQGLALFLGHLRVLRKQKTVVPLGEDCASLREDFLPGG